MILGKVFFVLSYKLYYVFNFYFIFIMKVVVKLCDYNYERESFMK